MKIMNAATLKEFTDSTVERKTQETLRRFRRSMHEAASNGKTSVNDAAWDIEDEYVSSDIIHAVKSEISRILEEDGFSVAWQEGTGIWCNIEWEFPLEVPDLADEELHVPGWPIKTIVVTVLIIVLIIIAVIWKGA